MAGKLKTDEKEGKLLDTDTVLNFDNNKDYKVIKLKGDDTQYVEHSHLAEKLVKKGVAEYVKGAQLEEQKENTKVID